MREIPVLRQQAENRRRGIPAGDSLLGNQRCQANGILANFFRYQYHRGAMF
jgi:hypothetical protein